MVRRRTSTMEENMDTIPAPDTVEVSDPPPSLEQFDVQTDSEPPAQAADSLSELVPRPVVPSNSIQKPSSNGVDKNAAGLSGQLEKRANSVDHPMQHAEEEENQLPGNGINESNEMPSNDTGGSDSEGSSASGSDKEGKYFYPCFDELEDTRPPEVGMKFPTLEDAQRYYNTYALLTGFVAVRGSNYKRKKFNFICNMSRKSTPVEDAQRKRKRSCMHKTQCQAKVIVQLVKGQWEFRKVDLEHNHPLSPSASLARFFLSHKDLSAEERSFLKVLQQSSIHPKKAMKILKRLKESSGDVLFSKKDAGNIQPIEQRRKSNSDVERTLKYFKELVLKNPCLSYTVQTDEENIVKSIFWTDARSRIDYEIFGDFILFDTTYSTNKHNMPFTPIIGMNNHGRTLVLGCALLQDHKAETFKWMFQTFLQVMGGKMPRAIITDQDEAISKAIAEVMPLVRHRFCKSHVMRRAREKLAGFMPARGNINAELHSLVDHSLTEKEFEEGWAALIEKYDASGNEFLQLMWQTRKNWVPVYFREAFYPFVDSAGRCEGTNLLFKDCVLHKDRIEKFIEKYEELEEKIIKTTDEDRLQSGTEPSYLSLQPIEKYAAHIYTRQIFLKVQRELFHSTAFNVQEIERSTVYRLDKVFDYENPEFDRNSFEVLVEPGSNVFKCQCAKFTRDGILCCHIFRLFTQLGINEIPAHYIVPRWTDKFKEEQLKQYKEECFDSNGINHSENTMRYAMLMSTVADIGKEICGDGAKCNRFMQELVNIQERLATTTGENS